MRKTTLLWFLLLSSITAQAIKPLREYRMMPEQAGLSYERLHVVTSDNYRIETWFYSANQPQKLISDTLRPQPTIIICNGDAGNMSYFQIALAEAYIQQGFHVVTFDWRGFGQSDPFEMNPNYFCYNEMLIDYQAVIEAVAARTDVDQSNIYCMGWSTGGYLTLIAGHRNKEVKGVIVRGVPTSFEDAIPLIKAQKGKQDANLLIPNGFPIDEMPLALAPRFGKPLMLVVGAQDDRTPPWMAQKIYDALPPTTPKRLMIVPGAKHGGEEAPEFVSFEKFIAQTSKFIRSL